jgi:hypothetical protein
MIQSHSLLPHEQQLVKTTQEEAQKAIAETGGLLLQLEQARKILDACQERQRMLVNMALARLGVTEFRQARIDGGNLIVEVPDTSAVSKPNGDAATGGASWTTAG